MFAKTKSTLQAANNTPDSSCFPPYSLLTAMHTQRSTRLDPSVKERHHSTKSCKKPLTARLARTGTRSRKKQQAQDGPSKADTQTYKRANIQAQGRTPQTWAQGLHNGACWRGGKKNVDHVMLLVLEPTILMGSPEGRCP